MNPLNINSVIRLLYGNIGQNVIPWRRSEREIFHSLGQKSVSRGNIGTMNKLGMNGGKNNGRAV